VIKAFQPFFAPSATPAADLHQLVKVGGPTVLSLVSLTAGLGSYPLPLIARLITGFAIAAHHISHIAVLLLW
jgi:hypothetical protein